MPAWSIQSPAVILLGAILFVAFVSVVAKTIILPILGIDWPFRPVRAPVRFSLLSITVLIVLAGVILGLLRGASDAAFLGLTILLVVWLTVVRYIAFRRALAEQSRRELATMLPPRENKEL